MSSRIAANSRSNSKNLLIFVSYLHDVKFDDTDSGNDDHVYEGRLKEMGAAGAI